VGGVCFVDEIGFAFGWIVEPEHVLVGHGEGIHEDAAALREAVSFARPAHALLGRGRPPGARSLPSASPLARGHEAANRRGTVAAMLEAGAEGAIVSLTNEAAMRGFPRRYR
jgi:hypothetical protein